jgi:hypothetical protein
MDTASPLPLVLTLHPLLAPRVPERGSSTLDFGYQLRLPDGPALAGDDPLLRAFGAFVVELLHGPEHEEALQHDAFEPGRRLTLVQHGVDDDGDSIVGAWDADGIRRAGIVPYLKANVVAAALEHGLSMAGVVLREERTLFDDRRLQIAVLVHAPALVLVDLDGCERVARPVRPRRNRVVLLADGSSELRWWDPSGNGGPMDLAELPLSAELAAELRRLSSAYVQAADGEDLAGDFIEGIERDWTRSALEMRTHELWRRARLELGQRYAIGLMAPGMTRPAWSPDEAGDDGEDEDEDLPF